MCVFVYWSLNSFFFALCSAQIDVVLLHQRHKAREYITGTLCLTDRHLIFIEPTGMKETWVSSLSLSLLILFLPLLTASLYPFHVHICTHSFASLTASCTNVVCSHYLFHL